MSDRYSDDKLKARVQELVEALGIPEELDKEVNVNAIESGELSSLSLEELEKKVEEDIDYTTLFCLEDGENEDLAPLQFKPVTKRQHTQYEILGTEEHYLRSLKVLIKRFGEPMCHEKIISKNDYEKIFRHVETIIAINQPFLNNLKKHFRENPKNPNEIAQFFMERSQVWKLYANYIVNHDHAQEHLNHLISNPKFRQYEARVSKKLQQEGFRSVTMKSLLIMPVQRIPRYRLLLSDLLKRSDPKKFSDYEDLKDALASISELATYCNTKKKDYEDKKKLEALQSKLHIKNFAKEDRTFIKEGRVWHEGNLNNIYLFNDILVMGKGSRAFQIDLKDPLLTVKMSETNANAFRIELKRVEFEWETQSPLLSNAWVTAIQKQQRSFNKSQNDEEYTIKEGYLRKSGGKKALLWRKRWHILSNKRMKYFDKKGGKLKGSYPIEGVKIGFAEQGLTALKFEIQSIDKTMKLKCDTVEELQSWQKAFDEMGLEKYVLT